MTDEQKPAATLPPEGQDPEAPQGPDQHPFFHWVGKVVTDHQNTLAGIIIVLAAILFFFNWQAKRELASEQEAARFLARAAQIYNQVVAAPQINPAQAEAALTEAIDNCDSVIRNHAGTDHANQARYIMGSCQFERAYHFQGTPAAEMVTASLDDAVESFGTYRDSASNREDKAKAAIALAACYENRAFFSEEDNVNYMRSAIEELDAAIDFGEGTYLEAQALIAQGRCLEALNEIDDARIAYDRVLSLREPLSRTTRTTVFGIIQSRGGYADLAKERLERIDAGIATPEA